MRIIVGLGNPGAKYEFTRHNAGFMALDAYAEELGLEWEANKKFNALIAKTPLTLSVPLIRGKGQQKNPPDKGGWGGKGGAGGVILIKPQTFMNLSGDSVQAAVSFYIKKPPLAKGGWGDCLRDSLVVVHDDLDIELGKIKVSVDSRAAGHNGVQSIIDRLGTKNFKRIRIGIKTEMSAIIPSEKFVLEKFKKEELETVGKLIPGIIEKIKGA